MSVALVWFGALQTVNSVGGISYFICHIIHMILLISYAFSDVQIQRDFFVVKFCNRPIVFETIKLVMFDIVFICIINGLGNQVFYFCYGSYLPSESVIGSFPSTE